MKYLIVTSYDSWYNYQVNIDGIKYNQDTDIAKEFYNKYWDLTLDQFYEWIKFVYEDYDLIMYIDDADIEIIKDNINLKGVIK